jgi:hypothetical protein
LAFIACAVVSVAGIIGWIGMIPKLVPIPWETLRPPARAPV